MTVTSPIRTTSLTIALAGKASAIDEITSHVAVKRYSDAGWAILADGIVVHGRSATVPFVVPEDVR